MNEAQEIKITTEFITLGQLLKFARLVGGGGEAKILLATETVLVNGESENRRGRKLRDGDLIEVRGRSYRIKG